jgi:RNA polymerase sigma-70 factor (ECF subfamily)
MVDPNVSPANQLTLDQERENVRKALLNLPIDQQQVIVLRFLEDLPHEQVAEIMGKTTEATRSLQYRALSALRSLLKDEDGVTNEH